MADEMRLVFETKEIEAAKATCRLMDGFTVFRARAILETVSRYLDRHAVVRNGS